MCEGIESSRVKAQERQDKRKCWIHPKKPNKSDVEGSAYAKTMGKTLKKNLI